MGGVSTVPHCDDVLPAGAETINLPEVSERLGIPVTRVHDLLRDGTLLAVRRAGVVVVPAVFLDDDEVVVCSRSAAARNCARPGAAVMPCATVLATTTSVPAPRRTGSAPAREASSVR